MRSARMNEMCIRDSDIPCEQTADVYNGPGGRDWTAYVDIDLSEQKVRYYNEKDEELFVTDCVTGDVSKGRSTRCV